MRRISRSRLVLLVGAILGLFALARLQAEDRPAKVDKPPATAAAAKPVTPKPLGDAVKKGLAYLAAQQQQDGGWNQGGGWRTTGQGGGRVEGKQVADPSDVGNTAISVLALLRAGSTPTEGPYAKNIARGIEYIRNKVEKADVTSLSVTDVQGTQLQTKIGTYVDTFLTALVLAEVKGKMPDAQSERSLVAALDKTIGKIEKNQNERGLFAGNTGWASVISQGLANKGLNRARQVGAKVSDVALKRAEDQVAANFDTKTGAFRAGSGAGLGGGGIGGFDARSISGPAVASSGRAALGIGGRSSAAIATAPGSPSDAGVALYSRANSVGNFQDISNTNRLEEKKARELLARKDARPEERQKANEKLKEIAATDKTRDQAVRAIVKDLGKQEFVAGFGSNGGEEFLSFLNISETLLAKGGEDWQKWDKTATTTITRVQDKDGSWSGQHCITGKTFCTSGALLVLMADRAPLPTVTAEKKDK